MTPALSITGLSKRYRRGSALNGVDLSLEPGEILGLVGPNGAGKSTLVKIACGLVRPSGGEVEVFGRPAGARGARARTGYLAETFDFPGWMRAEEVLMLHQRLSGSRGGERERSRLLERMEIAALRRRRVGELSKGNRQRLGLAQALVGTPRLVLLDEPASGLDPGGRMLVAALLSELREQGTAVVLNSHLLGDVERGCDRIGFMRAGRLAAQGSLEGLAGPDRIEIRTKAGTRIVDGTPAEVPSLVRQLVETGEEIYSVQPLRRGLDEVYTQILREAGS